MTRTKKTARVCEARRRTSRNGCGGTESDCGSSRCNCGSGVSFSGTPICDGASCGRSSLSEGRDSAAARRFRGCARADFADFAAIAAPSHADPSRSVSRARR
eukprot:4866252-Pleurochrysis_carterae.AAC.3